MDETLSLSLPRTSDGRVRCTAITNAGTQCRSLTNLQGEKLPRCWKHKESAHHKRVVPQDTSDPFDRVCRSKRKDGNRCTRIAIRGGYVCRRHGAQLESTQKKAKKRLQIEKAQNDMVVLGVPITGLSPQDALLEEIARTAGHVRWLQGIVQSLNPDDLVWGKTMQESSTGFDDKNNYEITKHEAVPSIWMDLYQKERNHLVSVCKVAISAGIAERQVKLAEQQGEIIVQILKATLMDPDLGLSHEQLANSRAVAAKHLRLFVLNNDSPVPAIR